MFEANEPLTHIDSLLPALQTVLSVAPTLQVLNDENIVRFQSPQTLAIPADPKLADDAENVSKSGSTTSKLKPA